MPDAAHVQRDELPARVQVPEWCRTDIEDAISDAVMSWVRAIAGGRTREEMSRDSETVARRVIAALQAVGVPFSWATGAGAEFERVDPERPNYTIPDPCRRPECAYGVPFDLSGNRCAEHEGMED